MIQINLVPDVKQELLRAQTQRNVVISIAIILAVAAAGLVILVALYVYGAQALMMKSSNDTIDKEYTQLSSVEDLDKMLTIQNQLNTVSSLNNQKNVTSRMYDMLNVVVPAAPHEVRIASVAAETAGDEMDGGSAEGTKVTIEGQTIGGYASLEVFEKMIAAAVIQYTPEGDMAGESELNCGDSSKSCRYLAVGGGDRSMAVNVSEMSFGEDQSGAKTLYFRLSFTVVPELLSNSVSGVQLKIGKDGNVTDSYLGIPRSIFGDRPAVEGGAN